MSACMSALPFLWYPYFDAMYYNAMLGCYTGFPMWRPMIPDAYQHPPPSPVLEPHDTNHEDVEPYPGEDFTDEFQGVLRLINEVRKSATADDLTNYQEGLKIVENYGLDNDLMNAFDCI